MPYHVPAIVALATAEAAGAASPVGPSSFAASQVAVAGVAVPVAPANPARRGLALKNVTATTVWIGPAGVTPATGLQLLEDETLALTFIGSVWAITGGAAGVVAVGEESL